LNEIQLSAFDEEQNKVVDQRIANVAAAAKSQPHLLRQVAAGLRRIDLTLESVVAGGKDVVDQAEKYRNLSIEDRFGLKGELRPNRNYLILFNWRRFFFFGELPRRSDVLIDGRAQRYRRVTFA
jgi:hypothetical protein